MLRLELLTYNEKIDCCAICLGEGFFNSEMCTFCNGTGEGNPAATGLFRNHFCNCKEVGYCVSCKTRCHCEK